MLQEFGRQIGDGSPKPGIGIRLSYSLLVNSCGEQQHQHKKQRKNTEQKE